jgi:hypothetical protein
VTKTREKARFDFLPNAFAESPNDTTLKFSNSQTLDFDPPIGEITITNLTGAEMSFVPTDDSEGTGKTIGIPSPSGNPAKRIWHGPDITRIVVTATGEWWMDAYR